MNNKPEERNVEELRKRKKSLNRKFLAMSVLVYAPAFFGFGKIIESAISSAGAGPTPPAYYEAYTGARKTLSALEQIPEGEIGNLQDLAFSLNSFLVLYFSVYKIFSTLCALV